MLYLNMIPIGLVGLRHGVLINSLCTVLSSVNRVMALALLAASHFQHTSFMSLLLEYYTPLDAEVIVIGTALCAYAVVIFSHFVINVPLCERLVDSTTLRLCFYRTSLRESYA
ncbi:hypothetical protein C8J56DRAFT_943602, partial [Mycena floridula]